MYLATVSISDFICSILLHFNLQQFCLNEVETWAMKAENLLSGEDEVKDIEMDVWDVVEGSIEL